MLTRARKIAETIQNVKEIHIVTHIDADGIAAGAIAFQTLERLGISHSISCVKQLDEVVLQRLLDENHELVWFTDLGSSITIEYPEIQKIVTDHHVCSKESDVPFHLNPHLFNLNGSYEVSGAGVTYLVSKMIDQKNSDLSALAVVGAIGDLQDRRFCRLHGTNRQILEDGRNAGVIQERMDIRFFGRETRPLAKLLQYSSDPFIPGLSGREDACVAFLQE